MGFEGNKLPLDLLLKIIDHVGSFRDVLQLSFTCKDYNGLSLPTRWLAAGKKITFDTIGELNGFPSRYCEVVQSVRLTFNIELATLMKCRNLRNLEVGHIGESEITYDLQALASFTSLHRLYFYGESFQTFEDIDLIADCPAFRDFSVICFEDLYDLTFLESCRDLTSLSLRGCESISGSELSNLHWCQALVSLDIDQCINVDEIPSLPPTLQHLSMDGCKEVTSIAFLAECAVLETLNICSCTGITNIEPLPLSIRHLEMLFCPQITCIDRLSSCHSLQNLETGRGSIDSFASLPSSIRYLNIGDLCDSAGEGVFTLDRLSSFHALQSLSMWKCAVISSLEPLPVQQLLQLEIKNCGDIADITPLASCRALKKLVLGDMQSLESLASLASCNALHKLRLSNLPGVKSLLPLAECESLCDLTLRCMEGITSLAPLADVVSLANLHLEDIIGITSVEALARCTSLDALVLRFCPGLLSIESLALCPALSFLRVEICRGLDHRKVWELEKWIERGRIPKRRSTRRSTRRS